MGAHPGTIEYLAEAQHSPSLQIRGHPLCSVARPAFISRHEFDVQRRVVRDVVAALRRARDVVVAERSRLALLGRFGEWIDQLTGLEVADVDHGEAIRLDGFIGTGLQFVEANADLPGGAGHADSLAEVFKESPPWATFADEFRPEIVPMLPLMVDTLVSSWRRWGRGGAAPALAVIGWRARDEITDANVHSILGAARAAGLDAWSAEPAELEWQRDRLVAAGRPCDLVFRAMLTPWVLGALDELQPLIAALRHDAVCMVNSFRAELMGNKALFALLTDPHLELGLTQSQRRAVNGHVPWGRIMRDARTTGPKHESIDLLGWVEDHSEQLVIKPMHDAAGQGVVLGWEVDDVGWRKAIDGALDGEHVVQQRIETVATTFPLIDGGEAELIHDIDPFVFDGELGTFFSRLSSAGLTNVSSGGSLVPTVIVAS